MEYLRLHAPDPRERRPDPRCSNPNEEMHCTSCDTAFRCGEAPYNNEGPLCPCCNKSEGLVDAKGRGVIILQL